MEEKLTVDKLIEVANYVKKEYGGDTEVVVCDDGMVARFFRTYVACHTKISENKAESNKTPKFEDRDVMILTTDLLCGEIV